MSTKKIQIRLNLTHKATLPKATNLWFRAPNEKQRINYMQRYVQKYLDEAKSLKGRKPCPLFPNPLKEAKEKLLQAKTLTTVIETQLTIQEVFPINLPIPTKKQIQKTKPSDENLLLVKQNLLEEFPHQSNNLEKLLNNLLHLQRNNTELLLAFEDDPSMKKTMQKEKEDIDILLSATLHHLKKITLTHNKKYENVSQEELNAMYLQGQN